MSESLVRRNEQAQKTYSKLIIRIYDVLVGRITTPFCWRSSMERQLAWYDQHVSANHLDVGVATAYYLDRCRFPVPDPKVSLLDINPLCLSRAAERIARYQPTSYCCSVFEPLDEKVTARFDSIGFNYVLHCLAGPFTTKAKALEHLRSLLEPGGIIFGSTVLGRGVPMPLLGRVVQKYFNWRSIFDNDEDDLESFDAVLKELFSSHHIEMDGCVALYRARK